MVSFLIFEMFYSRGVKGKEIILGSMFCLENFQMKADGVSKFLSYYLPLTVAGFTLPI